MTRVLVTLTSEPARGGELVHEVRDRHLAMLDAAGLVPVLAAGTLSAAAFDELLDLCRAVYLPGTDYVPCTLAEDDEQTEREAALAGLRPDPAKVGADLRALAAAWSRGLPALGVCGGMQAMTIFAGGRLRAADAAELQRHADRAEPQPVGAVPGTLAAQVLGSAPPANSHHRQLVAEVAAPLQVGARAPDRTIEAIEAPRARHPFWLGLQWHPERLDDARPYEALAQAAVASDRD